MLENKTLLKYILQSFIVVGVLAALINFFNFRSLWLDEVVLALNIVNKNIIGLLHPLNYNQVAPIGFLLVEKFFSHLCGNTDWSLRIFPMIAFFISIYLVYKLSYRIFNKKIFALFPTALFSLSNFIILYSSEVKQYMSDVLFCLIILLTTIIFAEKNDKKNLWLYSLAGVLSIWFSNISVILLLPAGLYFIYKIHKGNKNYSGAIMIIGSWLISFVIYFLLFIYNHPTKSMMINYWSNENAFLPQNIFSTEFYVALYYRIKALSGLLLLGRFSIWTIPIFCLGFFYFMKQKKGIFFLLLFPVIVNLFLAYLKIYPFAGRLILYLSPMLIIFFTSGFYYLLTFLNSKKQGFYSHLLIIPLILNLTLLKSQGFPIQKEEIKKSLTVLNTEIVKSDNIYVYYAAEYAFSFYKNSYQKISNVDKKNIIFGKPSRDNWLKYEDDISKIKGPVWILFSSVYEKNGASEEDYILNLFEKKGFKITEKSNYYGSSIYKAIPL